MSLTRRLIACAVLVGAGAAGHYALVAHLDAAARGAFAELRAGLASFPADLHAGDGSTWKGKEHPARKELLKQVPFADQVLYRVYAPESGDGALLLYAAHSRTGEDRKHHPEVCLREAAGTPEDFSARKRVPLQKDGSAWAQRFRFRSEQGGYMNLYYWHYTLPRLDAGAESALQGLHRRLAFAAPSISFQATTYAAGEELERFEANVLPAIDAALRAAVLPEGCTVGSDRIPVTFLRR